MDIEIRGVQYKQIQSKNGEMILKRFNEKYKMWVTARFQNNDDKQIIDNVINAAINVL